jgi:hypothetical protein
MRDSRGRSSGIAVASSAGEQVERAEHVACLVVELQQTDVHHPHGEQSTSSITMGDLPAILQADPFLQVAMLLDFHPVMTEMADHDLSDTGGGDGRFHESFLSRHVAKNVPCICYRQSRPGRLFDPEFLVHFPQAFQLAQPGILRQPARPSPPAAHRFLFAAISIAQISARVSVHGGRFA